MVSKALTAEEREQKMVALAIDLAEKQLEEGTAPPSVVMHYLRLATERDQIEKELLIAKAENVTAVTKMSINKDEVLEALTSYEMES